MKEPLIQCRDLGRTYQKGSVQIMPLRDVELEIGDGEFISLMGPSGSGKTTLLNILAGIDRPTTGELRVDGVDVTKLSGRRLADWRAANIGYIFQLYNLIPVLSAYENIETPLLLKNLTRKQRHEAVSTAMARTGITDRADHYPRQLSGGQEQRVAIARAIVSSPRILVADEPTGDLDSRSARDVLALIRRLNIDLGMTIIMVTHDEEIASLADRTVHLLDGQITDSPEKTGAVA